MQVCQCDNSSWKKLLVLEVFLTLVSPWSEMLCVHSLHSVQYFSYFSSVRFCRICCLYLVRSCVLSSIDALICNRWQWTAFMRSLFLPSSRYVSLCEAVVWCYHRDILRALNPLKLELNPICYLLALLGAHHFLHVSRIRVKLLTLRWLMSYIYGAPILDVSRSHTTTQHSR